MVVTTYVYELLERVIVLIGLLAKQMIAIKSLTISMLDRASRERERLF